MKKILFLLLTLSVVLAACGNNFAKWSKDDAVTVFKDAGLEVDSVTEMTKDDYGMAPMKAEKGVRFLIPSLGDDKGGRILVYDNEDDLKEIKAYYDDLGKGSAILFSWTAVKDNILIQINGDLPEEKYKKYKKALGSLK